jgi:hypothetical protein
LLVEPIAFISGGLESRNTIAKTIATKHKAMRTQPISTRMMYPDKNKIASDRNAGPITEKYFHASFSNVLRVF